MDNYVLMFWQPGPRVTLTPGEIFRELTWGEEVEGLIDLPIKEILTRLKSIFPQHKEQSGLLTVYDGGATFAATWTWQYLKVDCQDLEAETRQRLIDAVGFSVFDPQLGTFSE